jgi:hypothetical protein
MHHVITSDYYIVAKQTTIKRGKKSDIVVERKFVKDAPTPGWTVEASYHVTCTPIGGGRNINSVSIKRNEGVRVSNEDPKKCGSFESWEETLYHTINCMYNNHYVSPF